MTARKKGRKGMRSGSQASEGAGGVATSATSGLFNAGATERVHLVITYLDREHECLSAWTQDALRGLADLPRKLREMTWAQVYATAATHGKKGVGYTQVRNTDELPSPDYRSRFPKDTAWAELKTGRGQRVFGFRQGDAFYLVFLDRNHDVFA